MEDETTETTSNVSETKRNTWTPTQRRIAYVFLAWVALFWCGGPLLYMSPDRQPLNPLLVAGFFVAGFAVIVAIGLYGERHRRMVEAKLVVRSAVAAGSSVALTCVVPYGPLIIEYCLGLVSVLASIFCAVYCWRFVKLNYDASRVATTVFRAGLLLPIVMSIVVLPVFLGLPRWAYSRQCNWDFNSQVARLYNGEHGSPGIELSDGSSHDPIDDALWKQLKPGDRLMKKRGSAFGEWNGVRVRIVRAPMPIILACEKHADTE